MSTMQEVLLDAIQTKILMFKHNHAYEPKHIVLSRWMVEELRAALLSRFRDDTPAADHILGLQIVESDTIFYADDILIL